MTVGTSQRKCDCGQYFLNQFTIDRKISGIKLKVNNTEIVHGAYVYYGTFNSFTSSGPISPYYNVSFF